MSAKHCVITCTESEDSDTPYVVTVQDSSRHGVQVNKKKISGPAALEHGDVLTLPFGMDYEFSVLHDGEKPIAPKPAEPKSAKKTPGKRAKSAGKASAGKKKAAPEGDEDAAAKRAKADSGDSPSATKKLFADDANALEEAKQLEDAKKGDEKAPEDGDK